MQQAVAKVTAFGIFSPRILRSKTDVAAVQQAVAKVTAFTIFSPRILRSDVAWQKRAMVGRMLNGRLEKMLDGMFGGLQNGGDVGGRGVQDNLCVLGGNSHAVSSFVCRSLFRRTTSRALAQAAQTPLELLVGVNDFRGTLVA